MKLEFRSDLESYELETETLERCLDTAIEIWETDSPLKDIQIKLLERVKELIVENELELELNESETIILKECLTESISYWESCALNKIVQEALLDRLNMEIINNK